MEFERAARIFKLCFDGWLYWLKGHPPDHSSQHQPTRERRTPVSDVVRSSPILPGAALGNITQVEGTGNSSYNALWVTATRRLTQEPSIRRFVHLVQVARLQFFQHRRDRGPGQL